MSPAARSDWTFVRKRALLLVPAWGLAAWAGWRHPDGLYDSTMGVLWLGYCVVMFPIVFGKRPDKYRPPIRRAALIYLMGMVLYILMHGVRSSIQ